jgi:hypothetical protein
MRYLFDAGRLPHLAAAQRTLGQLAPEAKLGRDMPTKPVVTANATGGA